MAPRLRTRLAVLHPYWDFWAESTPFDLERSREQLLATAADRIRPHGDVVWTGLVDLTRVPHVRDQLAALQPDVVVVVQSMATPPAVTTEVLDAVPGAVVVVWVLRSAGSVRADFDHADITAEGATVGTPMLTSVLVRNGRPFDLITQHLTHPELDGTLATVLSAATAAASLRWARIGRVGHPIAGYDCVDLDPDQLRRSVGATVVPIEPAEVLERYQAVAETDVDDLVARIAGDHQVEADVTTDELRRAARSWRALDTLAEAHQLDTGAFNCHVPEIRLGSDIGIAPCFALGCATSAGIPWTCAGDVVTAVAMLAAKRLGAAALYHELEAFDDESGTFVIANSGEHDRALAPSDVPALGANPWYPGPPRSLCARLTAGAGPASLLGFVQLEGTHRFVVAPGEFVAGGYPSTGTANAAFRFADPDAAAAWRRWCLAGVNHHAVATGGAMLEAVRRMAGHLDVEVIEV